MKTNYSLRTSLALLLLLVSMALHAAGITLNLKKVTVKQAMDKIESVSKVHFFYKDNLADLDKVITLQVRDASVETCLDRLFNGTGIAYKIEKDNVVILTEKGKHQKSETGTADGKDKITGIVTDEKGEPLIGANVKLRNKNAGAITDIDGRFELEASNSDVLEVSYIGFAPQEIKVNQKRNFNIALGEERNELNEVVVVGFGSQKKVNLTGAVAVIDASKTQGRPVASAAQALQGLDPSVNIGINSGKANSGYSIDIRGAASLNGSTPLILVDGVETSLSRLNPNDIESVSILKDASAASIYGTKASAGVILVTTKSGGSNKTKVNYNAKYGWLQNTTSTDYVTKGYDWLRMTETFWAASNKSGTYAQYTDEDYAELWMRRNDTSENPNRSWAVAQTDGTYKYYGNFDWYGYFYKRTRMQREHNVSIRGGSDKVRYYVSGRYFGSDGIMNIQNDPYDSYSLRSKLSVDITKWLHYSNNISYYYGYNWWPGQANVQNTFSNVSYGATPYIVPFNPDGSIVHKQTYSNQSAEVAGGFNLLLSYGKASNMEKENEVIIKNSLAVDIVKNLQLHLAHSYLFRHLFDQYRYTIAPYSTKVGVETWTPDDPSTKFRNELTEANQSTYKHTFEMYLDYSWTVAKAHNFKAMVGMQYDTRYYRKNSITANGLLSEELNDFNLADATTYEVTGGQSRYKTLGYFGRFNYDYQGRYLVELSGRSDGSSRFWSKNRWAFFPSGSLGWRMSEEKFWKPMQGWWDNAKLRFSIGSLGNQQVSDYLFIQEINTKKTNDSYSLDGKNSLTYAQETAPVSNNLTWEKVTTYNWGVDLTFLQKLSLTADYYIRNTTGMMVNGASLPAVYGASVPKENAADMRTNGWEVGLSWHDSFKLLDKKFNYTLRANIGDYKTKVTRFDNETGKIGDHYVGETLGELWGWSTDGLFRTNEEAAAYASEVDLTYLQKYIVDAKSPYTGWMAGDLKYLDIDGDKKLSTGDGTIKNPGDLKVIGNVLPRYSYSFGGDFNWNGVDFSVLFQGIGKRDWYPGAGQSNLFWGSYCRPHNTFLSQQMIDNMWSEDNPDGYYPRPRGYVAYSGNYSHNAELTAINDRYIQNVAYLRLKNLTLGYTFSSLGKWIDQVRVYFTGENLFYWSPLKKHNKYIDPEQAVSDVAKAADSKNQSIGSGEVYSFSKSFSFGIDVTF